MARPNEIYSQNAERDKQEVCPSNVYWRTAEFLRLLRERQGIVASGVGVEPLFPELIEPATGTENMPSVSLPSPMW